jgi:hypothetical protein
MRASYEGTSAPLSALVPTLAASVEAFRGSALVKDDRAMFAVELASVT